MLHAAQPESVYTTHRFGGIGDSRVRAIVESEQLAELLLKSATFAQDILHPRPSPRWYVAFHDGVEVDHFLHVAQLLEK